MDVEVISNESHEQSEESPIRDETDIDAYSPEDSSLKPPVKKFRSKTTPFSSRSLALGDLEASSHATNEKHTEFDVFGSSVAAQLNNMPWENAIELQLQIQQLITRYRLNLHRVIHKGKSNYTAPSTSGGSVSDSSSYVNE